MTMIDDDDGDDDDDDDDDCDDDDDDGDGDFGGDVFCFVTNKATRIFSLAA